MITVLSSTNGLILFKDSFIVIIYYFYYLLLFIIFYYYYYYYYYYSFNTIEGWKKHMGSLGSQRYFSLMKKENHFVEKDGCKLRPGAATRSDILYSVIWSGKSYFYQRKVREL